MCVGGARSWPSSAHEQHCLCLCFFFFFQMSELYFRTYTVVPRVKEPPDIWGVGGAGGKEPKKGGLKPRFTPQISGSEGNQVCAPKKESFSQKRGMQLLFPFKSPPLLPERDKIDKGPCSTLRGCTARPGSSVTYCSPAAPTGPSP
jgi:hypothetical protein